MPESEAESLAMVHPDDRERVRAVFGKAMTQRAPYHIEHRLVNPGTGETVWVRVEGDIFHNGRSRLVGFVQNITEQKRAEAILRENMKRQDFTLRFSDALRSLADPASIHEEACKILAEHLDADRVYYAEIDEPAGVAKVEKDFVRGGAFSLAGTHDLRDFGSTVAILRKGESYAISNFQTMELIPDAERKHMASLKITAAMCVPLMKEGRWTGALCVTSSEPRTWPDGQISLLKEISERVFAAVERARAEEALRQQQALLASFMENSPGNMFIKDASGRYQLANKTVIANTGTSKEAFLGKTDAELYGEALAAQLTASDEAVRARGEAQVFEDTFDYAGRSYTFLSNKFPLADGAVGCVSVDITEMRRAERKLSDKEKQLQLAKSAARLGIHDYDPRTGEIYWDEEVRALWGVGADAPITYDLFMNGLHPDDRESTQAAVDMALDPKGSGEYFAQYRVISAADGVERWVEATGQCTFKNGEAVRLVGTTQDITPRKNAEAAEAEQSALLELIARGRPLPEVLTAISDSLSRLLPGARAAVLLADDAAKSFPNTYSTTIPADFGDTVKTAPISEICFGTCGTAVFDARPIACPDIANDERWAEEWRSLCLAHGIRACYSQPVLSPGGKALGSILITFGKTHAVSPRETEIADFNARIASIAIVRARAETALREREERFSALVNASANVVYRMSPDWREMRQLNGAGFIADTPEPTIVWPETYIPAEERSRVQAAVQKAIDDKAMFELEHKVLRPDGSSGWTLSRAVPLFGPRGEIVEWFGAASDVTARKEAEDALRESGERQAFLLKLSDALRAGRDAESIASAALELLRERLRLNRAYIASIHGAGQPVNIVAEDSRSGLSPMPRQLMPSDFPKGFQRAAEGIFAVNDIWSHPELSDLDRQSLNSIALTAFIVAPLHRGEEGMIWALVAGSEQPREWMDGEILMLAEAAERTWAAVERARAEAALRKSEERFRLVADNISQLAWTCENLGAVNWYNKRWLDYTGSTYEEMKFWGWDKVQHPEHVDRVVAGVQRAAASGEPWEDTFPLRRHDGEYRWFYSQAMPIRDPSGKIVQWFGTNTDITDLREAESALRESEERFRSFADNSADTLWILDAKTRELEYLSPAFDGMWGESRDVLMKDASVWGQIVHPDDLDIARQALPKVIAGNVHQEDYRIVRPDNGEVRWLRDTGFPIKSDDGQVRRYGGIVQDITKTKEIENALRTREGELARVQQIGLVAGVHIDLTRGSLGIRSPEYIRLHGLPQDTKTESHDGWLSRLHPEDREHANETYQAAVRGMGMEYHGEYRIIRPDTGETRWISARAEIDRAPDGRALRLVGTHIDITDRKRAEQALRESEGTLRAFYDNAPVFMGVVEIDGEDVLHIYDNPLSCGFFGLNPGGTVNRRALKDMKGDRATVSNWLKHYNISEETGDPARFEHPVERDGETRWLSATVSHLGRAPSGRSRFCYVAEDVTERKRAEERKQLLTNELNHRVKNTLAVVQAIASQTARYSPEPDDFNAAFSSRIGALARVHDVLTKDQWSGTGFQDLARASLAPFSGQGHLIRLAGPPVVISPTHAVTLSLALNELATNAVKYGALSAEGGYVTLFWTLARQPGGMALYWAEHGGPKVAPPAQTGFGSVLIERLAVQLGAEVTLEYLPHGVRCSMTFKV
jgi:PAS domain S-box-containing protein